MANTPSPEYLLKKFRKQLGNRESIASKFLFCISILQVSKDKELFQWASEALDEILMSYSIKFDGPYEDRKSEKSHAEGE